MLHPCSTVVDGRFMHSESFASTACAMASSWCVLGDWAGAPRPSAMSAATVALPAAPRLSLARHRIGSRGAKADGGSISSGRNPAIAMKPAHNESWPESLPATKDTSSDAGSTANRSGWRGVRGMLPARGYRGPHYYFYPARFACESHALKAGAHAYCCP